jgi:hypothetical protein
LKESWIGSCYTLKNPGSRSNKDLKHPSEWNLSRSLNHRTLKTLSRISQRMSRIETRALLKVDVSRNSTSGR